jgi:hypothetical protein
MAGAPTTRRRMRSPGRPKLELHETPSQRHRRSPSCLPAHGRSARAPRSTRMHACSSMGGSGGSGTYTAGTNSTDTTWHTGGNGDLSGSLSGGASSSATLQCGRNRFGWPDGAGGAGILVLLQRPAVTARRIITPALGRDLELWRVSRRGNQTSGAGENGAAGGNGGNYGASGDGGKFPPRPSKSARRAPAYRGLTQASALAEVNISTPSAT